CYRSLDDKLLIKYAWREIFGKTEIECLKDARPVNGVINLVASDILHRFTDNWENLRSLGPKKWHLKERKRLPREPDDAEEGESYVS
ncbi:Bgt-20476, partial [Blumeria graminis f. sp. tritici]